MPIINSKIWRQSAPSEEKHFRRLQDVGGARPNKTQQASSQGNPGNRNFSRTTTATATSARIKLISKKSDMRYDSNRVRTPTWAMSGYRSVYLTPKFSAKSLWILGVLSAFHTRAKPSFPTSNNIDYLLTNGVKICCIDPSSAKILWILSNSAKYRHVFRHQLVETDRVWSCVVQFFFILCQHSFCREIFVGENRSGILATHHQESLFVATKVHILGSSQIGLKWLS